MKRGQGVASRIVTGEGVPVADGVGASKLTLEGGADVCPEQFLGLTRTRVTNPSPEGKGLRNG
jgi:hypothetical protein